MTRLGGLRFYLLAELWLSLAHAVTFTVTAVYFVTTVGMNPLQLVLVGTVMEASIFVFEVPTGVVADTYSRRASLIAGWAVMGAAMILVGAVPSVAAILAGYAIWGLGYTFTSGAYEAWITDEVGAENVGPVFLRGARLSYVGALLGIGASVVLAASISLGTAIAAGGALLLALTAAAVVAMPETGFRGHGGGGDGSWRDLRATAAGGARLVRAGPLLLLILAITFFAGMSTESFDRLWQAHFIRDVGLPSFGSLAPVYWFGLFDVVAMLLGLVGSTVLIRRFERARHIVLARTLFVLTSLQLASVLLFGLTAGLLLGMLGLWAYRLTRSLLNPIYMTWLNQNIRDSRVRATVISISGQADAVGQVAGGPAIGAVGTIFSIRAALLLGGLVLAPALGLYARAIRHGGKEPELAELPQPELGPA
jgi:MFS transporter, DHA3 family, tetracycline resistance protein